MLKPLFSKKDISLAVKRLAREIENDFPDENIFFICLLKGSFIFASDLLREVHNSSTIDFMRVSSYGSSKQTTGTITVQKDIEEDISNKNVILIEDIIDSGLTLQHICHMLHQRNPKSLKICSLIDKKARREVPINGDYIGFTIDDGFVVGYGIDYAEQYRNLPDICILEE